MTKLATVNKDMLQRSVESSNWWSQSIMNTIHKVRIYNPNWFQWEIMDEEKKGKLILIEAQTWEQKIIEPFKFNILSVSKVTQGNIPMLTEDGDTAIKEDWSQDIRYFYTNQYNKFLRKDEVLWLTSKWMKPLWFRKEDFFNFIKTPKVNWHPNPFFEWKKAKDNTKYKSSLLETQDVIYWVIIDWEYAGEYFQMKIKPSAMWSNYDSQTKSQVEAKEWTITRLLDDALKWYNELLESNWLRTVRRLEPEVVDIKMNIKQIEVSGKEFNVADFEFAGYTASRTDNKEDLDYISDFNYKLFQEAFWAMQLPLDIEFRWTDALVDLNFEVSQEMSTDVVEWLFEEENTNTKQALESGAQF